MAELIIKAKRGRDLYMNSSSGGSHTGAVSAGS